MQKVILMCFYFCVFMSTRGICEKQIFVKISTSTVMFCTFHLKQKSPPKKNSNIWNQLTNFAQYHAVYNTAFSVEKLVWMFWLTGVKVVHNLQTCHLCLKFWSWPYFKSDLLISEITFSGIWCFIEVSKENIYMFLFFFFFFFICMKWKEFPLSNVYLFLCTNNVSYNK